MFIKASTEKELKNKGITIGYHCEYGGPVIVTFSFETSKDVFSISVPDGSILEVYKALKSKIDTFDPAVQAHEYHYKNPKLNVMDLWSKFKDRKNSMLSLLEIIEKTNLTKM